MVKKQGRGSSERFVHAALVAAALWLGAAEAQAACKLLEVSDPKGAKFQVYFTKFASEDNTGGKYKACRLVKKAEPDAESFFVTKFRHDAQVIVHPDNWPKG